MQTALAIPTTDDARYGGVSNLEKAAILKSRYACEHSLLEYVKQTWDLVEPDTEFVSNWHVEQLCRVLEKCYRKEIYRVVMNVPPGTLKSLLVEVFFPTWVWARNPDRRFMTASYGQHLTMRDNLRARQIIESPWFQKRWPVALQEDQNTKTRYNTTNRGWRIATSVNGQGIGEHPDFIIIDDPHTAQQAESETERQSALDWFDRTIATRLGRNPVIIVIMQRLHVGDLSGHLLARGGWSHVCWPMRFERCSCPTSPAPSPDAAQRCAIHQADPTWKPDPLDPRMTEGELLFPALFPETKVKQLELDLGPYGSAGQLQQRPSPLGGGLFKAEWFKYCDVEPDRKQMRLCRGWDTAASEGKGDYTVGALIGELFETKIENGKRSTTSTGHFYVLDVVRDQLRPEGVDRLMKATADRDGKGVAQREEREGGASGKAQIAARTKLLVGHDYKEVQLGLNKVVRAKPYRSQVEGGNVYLLRAPWNAEYVRELCQFPTGAHDDQVDASSCSFNAVLLEPPPRQVNISWSTR